MQKFFKSLGYILSLVIIILALTYLFSDKINLLFLQDHTSTQLSSKTLKQNFNNRQKAEYNWHQVKDSNMLEIAKSKIKHKHKVIALVTQPEAKVATSVVAGVNNDDLAVAAGTLRPDQVPGKNNYVLAGHHMPQTDWALFSGIYYYAKPDQNVYLTDLKHVYQYQIKDVQFINANAVYIANKNNYQLGIFNTTRNKPMITLFSCDATGEKRIAEFGSLVHTYQVTDKTIPQEAISGFKKAGLFKW